jgi:hypothetical protein
MPILLHAAGGDNTRLVVFSPAEGLRRSRLLDAQRRQRIDAGRPPCGETARDQRRQQEDQFALTYAIGSESVAANRTIGAVFEGFVTVHRSSGYSNHRHPERSRGRVDVMYVRGVTADKLFASANELRGPGGRAILVPKPEHLIAMKVQAMKDAPERTWQDLVDIAYLLRLEGVNQDEARGYFEKAGLEERWHELARIR